MSGSDARFEPAAATDLRAAIRQAGGVEVFAIGDVTDGRVTGVTVTCRGQRDRVIALVDRPRPGQVVIHNHPSGDLRPSDADMHLAGRYGDDGVGFVIVDSDVARANWVVEPHVRKEVPLDPDAVSAFFRDTLPRALPGFEARDAQVEMARAVAVSLSDDRPLIVEAGTGTGKSLAYLVPAAMWALANDRKVVVSTYTKALQGQLLAADLPILTRAGLEVTYAVLLGRNNYVCKRRLALAAEEDRDRPDPDRADLDALVRWETSSADGTRLDLPHPVRGTLWQRVESDSDLTLRVKCPHYATCHFYTARRRAAAAHIVVVNHALLVADRAVRDAGGPGVLPKYGRVVLDEAHHLEAAATGAIGCRLTLPAVRRAIAPLRSTPKRPGALARIVQDHCTQGGALPPERWTEVEHFVQAAHDDLDRLANKLPGVLEALANGALDEHGTPRRIRRSERSQPLWAECVEPAARLVHDLLDRSAGSLASVLRPFEDLPLPASRAQSVLDTRRGLRRLSEKIAAVRAFLTDDPDACIWVGLSRSGGDVYATLEHAPIDVAEPLRRLLWGPLPGTVATSATLTVNRRFDHWKGRVGLVEATSAIHPSPFDHAAQALLALPKDLPEPNHPRFLLDTARVIERAIRASGGGAFVLCTSYAAVRAYARHLRDALPASMPVLEQQGGGRTSLLARFRETDRAVLVGTDSFWEGVDVRGDALRLVVIPRLPFRVPTDPLQEARQERIAQRGGNPFLAFTLPEAVIKLRQGYGRLIRHRSDRGVVLLLDRRIHERRYGRVLLHSLPPARRIVGPWRRVHEEIIRFYADHATRSHPRR